ncbi:MAG: hypothetical protein ACC645_17230 [Pirellulales bacterium]
MAHEHFVSIQLEHHGIYTHDYESTRLGDYQPVRSIGIGMIAETYMRWCE